jgi:hypothetical protein
MGWVFVIMYARPRSSSPTVSASSSVLSFLCMFQLLHPHAPCSVLVGAVVYVVGGVMLNHFYFGAELGVSAIPQWEFWSDVPALMKVSASSCACL